MKNIQHIKLYHEKISFAIDGAIGDNGILSQNHIAVTPNCQNWLFLRPNTATNGIGAGVNPSYKDFVQTKHLSSYDGVTPQNKPFGEYVGRFLYVPRVNPITLLGRFSQTQKHIGAFTMNAISNTIQKFSIFTPIESLVLGFIFGLPIACLVIGILAYMGV